MKLTFMRHGQTNYNLLQLCNADPEVDVHLTEVGIQQVQQVRGEMVGRGIDQILCSPLPRTRHSAEIVNELLQVPLEPHALLHDIRSGCESRPVEEYFAAIAHDPVNARVGDGESLHDHKLRIGQFLRELAQTPWQHVLCVGHEETLRAAKALFEGLDGDQQRALHFANTEWLEYELKPDLILVKPA